MNLGVLSTDFQNAELQLLETVYFTKEETVQFISGFPSHSPIKELVMLSTCNRVEFYYSSDDKDASDWLIQQISSIGIKI